MGIFAGLMGASGGKGQMMQGGAMIEGGYAAFKPWAEDSVNRMGEARDARAGYTDWLDKNTSGELFESPWMKALMGATAKRARHRTAAGMGEGGLFSPAGNDQIARETMRSGSGAALDYLQTVGGLKGKWASYLTSSGQKFALGAAGASMDFGESMMGWGKERSRRAEMRGGSMDSIVSMMAAGCWLAASIYGAMSGPHKDIAEHVNNPEVKTWKVRLTRGIYWVLRPLFKALLKEAHRG